MDIKVDINSIDVNVSVKNYSASIDSEDTLVKVLAAKGDKGDKGTKGDKGDKGDKGEQGNKGDAFTYSDFTEEQLASLKGEKGDKGDTGEQGIQGIQGIQGVKGDTGDNGISPSVEISKSGKVTTITITDVDGTHTATINDGADGQGSGDMEKSVYDTNNNGTVDNAEKVNNHTVESDVPQNAKFTDTVYDDTNLAERVTTLETTINNLTNLDEVSF